MNTISNGKKGDGCVGWDKVRIGDKNGSAKQPAALSFAPDFHIFSVSVSCVDRFNGLISLRQNV